MSLNKKLSAINGIIIVIGFLVMIAVMALVNYRFSVVQEKQKMNVYLANSIQLVDDKLKDMARVSLICFSDKKTQAILKEYGSYDYRERIEAENYLKNLNTSLVTIRNDIRGVFIFDLETLIFSQDVYPTSRKLDYDYPAYINRLKEMEVEFRNMSNCSVMLDLQPEFMRYTADMTGSREDSYCIYFIREIKSFSPNVPIGHIVLTAPVKVTRRLLEEYLEPETAYFLITEDGKIVSANKDNSIGENMKQLQPQIFQNLHEEKGEFLEQLYGESYLFSYMKSPYSGMVLVTGRPNSILVKNSREFIDKCVIVLAVLLLFTVVLSSLCTKKMTRPLRELSGSMANFNWEDFNVRYPVERQDETGVLVESFNLMMDQINRLIEQEYESKVRLKEAELNENKLSLLYLKNQINSHFLYNTLDNIRMKAQLDGSEDVASMIMLLVEFFRLSVKVEEQVVPLERELRLIEVYLRLMCHRYPLLEYEFRVDESLRDCLIPNFILQPIVENSVLHGLKMKRYQGKILVSVQPLGDGIVIKVYDNGSGMSDEDMERIKKLLSSVSADWEEERQQENHIGIANVQKRLKIYYPEEVGLAYTNNEEGGVTVTITMEKKEI